jgi:hypothetical protein
MRVADRAISQAQAGLPGRERAFAAGLLNLRGMTVAGRIKDKKEGKKEAERHIEPAWEASERFRRDENRHSTIFGPQDTATHVLAPRSDLGRPREALKVAEDLDAASGGCPLLVWFRPG